MGRPKGSKNKQKLWCPAGEKVEGAKPPTAAQLHQALKRRVALCVADGMPPGKIAAVMALTLEKLQALFAHEIAHGREIVRADELMRLDAASGEGKVAASKLILETAADGTQPPGDGKKSSGSETITARALRVLNGGKSSG